MNKNKIVRMILLIIIGIISLNYSEVLASSFSLRVRGRAATTGIVYRGSFEHYADPIINNTTVEMQYQVQPYCLDDGISIPNNTNLTCQPTNNIHLAWILKNAPRSTAGRLAVQMVALATGVSKSRTPMSRNLLEYYDGRKNNFTDPNLDLKKAKDLAQKAMRSGLKSGNRTNITITPTGGQENTVTYKVNSTSAIETSDIKFNCVNCTIKNQTWNRTSGTLEVVVNEGKCNHQIKVTYPSSSSGAYICSGSGLQQVGIYLDSSASIGGSVSTTGTSSMTYKGTINATNGGEYYQKYCINEPTEEPVEQDKCTQKTTYEIPDYCDNTDEKIKITAPTDIKYCILKHDDEAGKTYQITQEDPKLREDNKYCSVWCKEDFESTMPNAQYANSGRYFNLSDVKAKGVRTCYATSGAEKSKEEPNIDIDGFVTDIIQLQKDIISAYNAWQRAEATYTSVQNATSQTSSKPCPESQWYCHEPGTLNKQEVSKFDDRCPSGWGDPQEEKVCDKTHTETWYEGSKQTYTGYSIPDFDPKTGKPISCSTTFQSTAQDNYGKKITGCANDGACNAKKEKAGTYETQEEYATAASNAKQKLNELKEALKLAIEDFEACYSWTNDYCFEPNIEFDYGEQYDVNYKLKSSSVSPSGEGYYTEKAMSSNEYPTTEGKAPLNDYQYVFCTDAGCDCANETALANQISTLEEKVYYLKKEATGEATYGNTQTFATKYPNGTISSAESCGALGHNYACLGQVYPVALNTLTGAYTWTLKLTNVGMYNENKDNICTKDDLGRLNEVVKELGGTLDDEIDYVCTYIVDCDNCDYKCDPDLPGDEKCYLEDCDEPGECTNACVGPGCNICTDCEEKCPNCDVFCVDCIFNGKETYFFRVISPNEFNPSGRTLGSNWTNEKGAATKKKIEEDNESVYVEAQYSYVITPEQMARIRKYNEETGNYVSQDLEYYKLSSAAVYGVSTFLNEGQKKGYFTELKRNTDWTTYEDGTSWQ